MIQYSEFGQLTVQGDPANVPQGQFELVELLQELSCSNTPHTVAPTLAPIAGPKYSPQCRQQAKCTQHCLSIHIYN